jgi:hypothetical protein
MFAKPLGLEFTFVLEHGIIQEQKTMGKILFLKTCEVIQIINYMKKEAERGIYYQRLF